MRALRRALLGLALVEVAHSLPAQGKPGLISVRYRKKQTQPTASAIEPEPDDSENAEPEPKDEEKEETPGRVSSWFESLYKRVPTKSQVHPEDEALLHQIDRLCEEEDFETALEMLNATRVSRNSLTAVYYFCLCFCPLL